MPTTDDLLNAISAALRDGTVIDPEPHLGLPLADAFSIQTALFRQFDQPLLGSKLASKGAVAHSAPLLFVKEGGQYPHQSGLAIEVELALVLGKDLRLQDPSIERGDIVDAISSVRLGVELLRSRYKGGSRGDPGLAVADLMSNIGYLLGPELDRGLIADGVSPGRLTVALDGRRLYDDQARHADSDPLKALLTLCHQAPLTPLVKLEAGQVITTGTLCGLLTIDHPGQVAISLAGQTFQLDLHG